MSTLSDAVERASKSMRDAPDVEQTAFGPVDQTQVLRLIGLDPRNPIAHAVVAVARRYALDPVLGHIAIIPKVNRPYITRDGFLHIAHRSGQFDGMEVLSGPTRVGAEWMATVAVFRRDMTHAFVYPGRASVAADNGPEMAITRAERRALKRAFDVALPGEFGDDGESVTVPVPALSATESAEPAEPRVSGRPEPQSAAQSATLENVDLDPTAPTGAPVELSNQQRKAIFAQWSRLGLAGTDEESHETRLALYRRVIGRPFESTKDLSETEASQVISTLANVYPNEAVTEEMTARLVDTVHNNEGAMGNDDS
jgi:hypothetical protein